MTAKLAILNRRDCYSLIECGDEESSRWLGDYRTRYEAEFARAEMLIGNDIQSLRDVVDKRWRDRKPKRDRFQRIRVGYEVI